MVEATVNGVTTRYRYDGEGRRIKKMVGTAVTRFVYGMGGELIAEHEGTTATSTTPTKDYVYGPTGMLAEVTGAHQPERHRRQLEGLLPLRRRHRSSLLTQMAASN